MKFDLDTIFGMTRGLAVVGATERFAGQAAIQNPHVVGFQGAVYCINPRIAMIGREGYYASLSEVPTPVDVVVVLVSADATLRIAEEAAAKGAKMLVIPGAGFSESGPAGVRLQQELLRSLEITGTRVIGPNCMGYINVVDRTCAYIGTLTQPLKHGPIAALVQSGSIFQTLVDAVDLGFSRMVSTGNEANISMAEYLDWLANDDETRVILIHLEAIRDPEGFLQALDRCRNQDKAVIVLKTGRTPNSAAIAIAHSGALATEWAVESAVLRRHGALLVDDVDEWVTTAQIIATSRTAHTPTLGVLTLSGGQAELIADIADTLKVQLPMFSEDAIAEMERVLPELKPYHNPLDGWKSSKPYEEVFGHCLKTIDSDPTIDVVAVAVDAPASQGPAETEYISVMAQKLGEIGRHSPKPLLYFTLLGSMTVDLRIKKVLDDNHVPLVQGVRPALKAVRLLYEHCTYKSQWGPPNVYHVNGQVGTRVATDGIAARNFIREMGFYCPDGHMVQTLDGAIDVAATIHYPVVLKALVPGIHHKSDVGAVEVNLRSPSELGSAWEKMKTKFGKVGCLVEKMVPNGPEILLGFKSDPRYGPIVIVGWGGYSTELVNDVTFLVPPFTEKQVSSAIGNLKISKMLSGFRASQKIDPHHLVNAVLRMGDVAQKYYRSVAELEINPLIVSNDGTWAVDALLVNFISKEG